MHLLDYYIPQSPITDPDEHANLFISLPCDIAALCKVIQGLLLHETDGKLFEYAIPKERMQETNLRYVRQMLARILELDNCPLAQARPPDKRLVVSCRDFAVMLCGMLRQHKIPARLRIGFSTYTYPISGFHGDHSLLEYWHAGLNKWCLVDARTSPFHIQQKRHTIDFNIYDVPHDRFFFAGKVWRLCRSGQMDPNSFGFGLINRVQGWWYIRNKVLQDMAALNKREPLLWDVWGMMLRQEPGEMPTLAQQLLVDEIAELTFVSMNENISAIQAVYAGDAELRVPQKIIACSPAAGNHEVTLNY
jgi:hypothetical protein